MLQLGQADEDDSRYQADDGGGEGGACPRDGRCRDHKYICQLEGSQHGQGGLNEKGWKLVSVFRVNGRVQHNYLPALSHSRQCGLSWSVGGRGMQSVRGRAVMCS